MNPYQIFAFDRFFHIFPRNESLGEVLKLIEEKSSQIVIKKAFVTQDIDDIITHVLILADDLEQEFFSFHDLVTVIDKISVSNMLEIELERKPTNEELIGICSFLDTSFSCNLPIQIKEALKQLNIKN